MGKLVLIRGLPGSGKSTMAKTLTKVGFVHFEADHFFEKDGGYNFDPSKLSEAHEECLQNTRAALTNGDDVVVANTFTQQWEMDPYRRAAIQFNADLYIIKASGNWENLHGVPVDAIERMKARWED